MEVAEPVDHIHDVKKMLEKQGLWKKAAQRIIICGPTNANADSVSKNYSKSW
ncbi:MAG: hypothetical protein R2759_16270 [Bacteroidales bacterium]